ncbi:MAG: alpha/beta hydrolase [Deltaproteobacteria bacterium]|nr:alpha/beta hydrolase [Deltaproteobacteria bacterium]
MASFRAAAINALLRATVKKIWKPDIKVSSMRKSMDMATVLCMRSAEYSVLATPAGAIDRVVVDGQDDKPLVILYLHGGAFCWHNPPMYRGFVTRLCKCIGGASGYLPDYRLAPEHKFPAAVEDCVEAYRWLLEQPGVDPGRLVLAGDSAGGSLVLTTLMQVRDQGLPLPACAVALSPFTDATGSGSSVKGNVERDVLFTPEALDVVLKWYLPEAIDPADSRVSPLLGDLQGLPPLLFQVGDTEMLLDDSVRFADKIIKSGGLAELQVWDDMAHAFQILPWLPESKQALEKISDFVHQHTTSSSE